MRAPPPGGFSTVFLSVPRCLLGLRSTAARLDRRRRVGAALTPPHVHARTHAHLQRVRLAADDDDRQAEVAREHALDAVGVTREPAGLVDRAPQLGAPRVGDVGEAPLDALAHEREPRAERAEQPRRPRLGLAVGEREVEPDHHDRLLERARLQRDVEQLGELGLAQRVERDARDRRVVGIDAVRRSLGRVDRVGVGV